MGDLEPLQKGHVPSKQQCRTPRELPLIRICILQILLVYKDSETLPARDALVSGGLDARTRELDRWCCFLACNQNSDTAGGLRSHAFA